MGIRDDLIRKKEEYAGAEEAAKSGVAAPASAQSDIRAALEAKREQYASEAKAPAASVLPGITDAALSTTPGSGALLGTLGLTGTADRQRAKRVENANTRLMDAARARVTSERERQRWVQDAENKRADYYSDERGDFLRKSLAHAEEALSYSGGQKDKDEADRGQETFGEHALNLLGDAAAGFMRGVGNPVEAMARIMELPEDALYWITGDERFNQDSPDRLEGRASKALTQSSEDTFALSRPVEERPMLERALVQTAQAAGNMLSAGAIYGQAFGAANTAGLEAAANATPALGASLASRTANAVTSAGARAGLEILRNPGNFGISLGSGVNAYSEAMGNGADFGQAVTNGFAKGLAEYFSNKLFSGTPFENNPAEKGYVTRLTEHIAQKLGKSEALAAFNTHTGGKVFNWVMDKTGEGMEEVVTAIADPLIDRLTYDEDADFATADELVEEFLGGILLSLAMSPAETLADNVERHRVGADLLTGETVQQIGDITVPGVDAAAAALIESGLESPEGTESRTLAEAALEKAQAGRKVNALDMGRMAAANAAQVASEEAAEERSFADAQDDNAGKENGRVTDAEERGRQIAAPTENEAARAAENVTMTAEDRVNAEIDAEKRSLDAMERTAAGMGLGENGAAYLRASYRGGDAAAHLRDYVRAYNAGVTGEELGTATATQQIAWNAGRMDAAQSVRDNGKAVVAKKPGLVRDASFKSANISAEQERALDVLGRVTGSEIRFGRLSEDENARYDARSATITVNVNAKDPVMAAATHEIVHRIRDVSPEAYKTLRQFVVDNMSDRALAVSTKVTGKVYNTNDVGYITEEMVANAFGRMAENNDLLDQFVREHRTAAQRVLDALRDLIDRVRTALRRGPTQRSLSNAQNREFEDLLGRLEEAQRTMEAALETVRKDVADTDLVTVGGVVMAKDVAEKTDGDVKPLDYMDEDAVKNSIHTEPAWEENYRSIGGDNADEVISAIRSFTDAMIANDVIYNYVPHGNVKYDAHGPLRSNMEYVVTFDMDASCPRTFQFLNYRNALMRIAGRPLTFNESIQLIELMRAYGQQIPCTYCYVENKRILLASSYLNWFDFHTAVLAAGTDEDAKTQMYSYNAKKGTLSKAAEAVFREWRSGDRSYRPSATEVWTSVQTAKNSIFNWLDTAGLRGSADAMTDAVCEHFGVTNKQAAREIADYVAEWRYDQEALKPHSYAVQNDESVSVVDERALAMHRTAMSYAKSASSARVVDNYAPYTDQFKNITATQRRRINAQGGVRKHSSNDFRMDYVQDYFLFFADLAAYKMMGHTYTKNADYVKIFGRTGDRINISVAFDEVNGRVRENRLEGMLWDEARQLRKDYYDNVGVMAMVTSDRQLSYAMNADWIDMIIPFHASGLRKEVWYNLKMWSDYTSKQNELWYTTDEMKSRLRDAGVEIPKRASAADVKDLFDETFHIKKIINEDGTVLKPHFLPGEYTVNGQTVPGHHNDKETYLRLCREYGVNPRFNWVMVDDGHGKQINVVDHPNYMRLVKETARTETKQKPIQFNLDKVDPALGMSPFDYAMQRMQEEAQNGGYANTADDPFGIVDEFRREYLGKNIPLPADLDAAGKPMADNLAKMLTPRANQYREALMEMQQSEADRQAGILEKSFAATEDLSPTGDPDIRHSLKEADELYNREYDFTQPMTTDEFRELIKQENDPERYFPKGLSPEFLKTITNKSRFTRPKLYRGIEAAEFDFLAENGYLKSNSSYNFANQQGQTLADEDAGYALSYATGFAPKDIADKHYKDGLPTYLIEFINAPDLNVGKNEVQESYTYGEIDQRFITRVFEIMYDQETGKDMIQDVTNDAYTRAALPRLGWALSGLSHGVPKFYRDKTTGTILYAVQGADGYENGLYVSEKFPDVTFRYSQLGKEFKPEAAQQFFGVSGDEADLEPVRVGEDGRLVHDDGVRYSLKERDDAYAAAVEGGDMETAQRMVDEAAKAAGYNVKVYHGTPSETISASRGRVSPSEYEDLITNYADKLFPFVVFRPNSSHSGIYTTTDQGVAKIFSFNFDRKGTIYDLYARMDNPLVIDANGRGWTDVPVDSIRNIGYEKQGRSKIDDIVAFAKDRGYDGLVVKNVREGGVGNETDVLTNDVIVFSSAQVKSADPVTYDDDGNVIPLSERFNPEDEDIRRSRSGREILDEQIQQFGAIPEGENPVRDVPTPVKTSDKQKLSQTVRTVLEAQATPEEMVPTIEKLTADGTYSYTQYSDKAAIQNAEDYVKNLGWAKAYGDWLKDVQRGVVNKTNTAIGWALYNNAANSGDTESALTVLDAIVKHQRAAAQAVQATRILKKLSPETQLYNVAKSVQRLQEEINQRYGEEKGPKLKVDPKLGEEFLNAGTDEQRAKVLQAIYKDIGRQMPTHFMDRWNAWRYLAMLGNPRTHVRNILGNAGFAPVVAVKDLTATAIEAAVDRVSGGKLGRTKGNLVGKGGGELLQAAWKDYDKVADQALGGGKYQDGVDADAAVQEGRIIFGNTGAAAWDRTVGRALERARRFNGTALDKEDVWFSRPHYALALAQYCKANKITPEMIAKGEGVAAARAYAIKEAQKATYRDTNQFSQAISRLGRGSGWDSNRVTRGVSTVIEGILPFRKTPANILARGVEYSPLGLLRSLTVDMIGLRNARIAAEAKAQGKKPPKFRVQPISGAEMIDHLAAGLTGTGLVMLGAWLASLGLVRGHGGDDDKRRKQDELMGHQNYALELPDGTSITLDWLAPECLPFFIGVNLWEQGQEETDGPKLADILSAVGNVTEPMLEMSCLQSLNAVFDTVGYAKEGDVNALTAALASAATSYLTQALPTLAGQGERTAEDKRYTTYTDKNSFLTGDMQYTLGKASARIPGLDYGQIPYIDAWGREELTGSFLGRAFNNFINPSFTSKVDESAMEKELLRLYEATGESVLPQRAPKYFNVDKERKDLTGDEYVTYATARGQTAYTVLGSMVISNSYKALSDADKAKAVEMAYTYANQTAMTTVGGKISTSYKWVSEALEAKEKGVPPDKYILIYTTVTPIGAIKDADGKTIDNSRGLQRMEAIYNVSGLTDDQRRYLFECFDVGKTIINYNKARVEEELKNIRGK